jgi:tight adherence protein B
MTLDDAGLPHLSPSTATLVLLLLGVLVGSLTYELTKVFTLSLAVAIGAIGSLLEALNSRAKSRRETVAALWPEILDSLISAMSSGSSIAESILALADDCPVLLRPHFEAFKDDIDSGIELSKSLKRLKARLGHVHADRLIELLRLVEEVGGVGLTDSLRSQVQLVRQEVAFKGEISSKLGWITGTAKFAVGAPWLLVAMLSTRPENAAAYASAEGSAILLLGLAVSIFAFRLVQVFSLLPTSPRVFA